MPCSTPMSQCRVANEDRAGEDLLAHPRLVVGRCLVSVAEDLDGDGERGLEERRDQEHDERDPEQDERALQTCERRCIARPEMPDPTALRPSASTVVPADHDGADSATTGSGIAIGVVLCNGWWHATARCSMLTRVYFGSSSAQISGRCRASRRNRQPDGGLTALGSSPSTFVRASCPWSTSGFGTESSSPWV